MITLEVDVNVRIVKDLTQVIVLFSLASVVKVGYGISSDPAPAHVRAFHGDSHCKHESKHEN